MKKKERKISWVNIVRRVIQLIAFILLPGLFITTFSSIKIVYTAIIGSTFSFNAQLPQLLTIIAVLGVTILFGRFFCGFVCSFGALADAIWFLSCKIRKKPVLIPEKADRVFKLLKYALLVFIVVFIWTLGSVSFNSELNPWNIFGMYTSLPAWASLGGLLTIGGLLLLLIMVGSFFVERFFCRYLCPLGAIFAIVSRLRIFKVRKAVAGCKTCRVCTHECAMGIPLYRYDNVSSGECINCFECVGACPRKNAQAVIGGRDAAPLAAGVVAAAAIMGLSYVGNIVSATSVAEAAAPVVSISKPTGNYADGTYVGSAQGYRGETTVKVTVENGYITDIGIVSTGDDREFMSRAESAVVSAIIASQSAQVDAVTGATYSSYGIMDAVANALSVTVDTQAAPSPSSGTQTPQPSVPQSTVQATPETYTDGVYTGVGMGFRGETTVTVTVSGGVITDIEIVSYVDDREYFNRATAVVEDILSTQTLNVDTVSGATFSSNGILEAVANALNVDFATQATPEGGHGWHGGRG